MLLGAHVSIAGGMDKAPARAAAWGCEVFQTFSRSPQGGPAPKLTPEIVANFKAEMKKFDLKEHFIHAPYYINFASANPRIQKSTPHIIREELERGTLLGSKYVVTHLGSAKEVTEQEGLDLTVNGVVQILQGYTGTTQLLLEIAAGSGATIGDTFEELAYIIENAEKKLGQKNVVNVCLDTQHAFASGYDLRTSEAVADTIKTIKNTIGLKRLKLSHINDSKVDFGAHVDRHANIGEGKMGVGAFKALLGNSDLSKINWILETPHETDGAAIIKDLKTLKKIRG